jgi:hypothetical protein
MGWTEGPEFQSLLGQELSLLHVIQTGSGAQPAPYLMGTGGSLPGGYNSRDVKLTTRATNQKVAGSIPDEVNFNRQSKGACVDTGPTTCLSDSSNLY